MSCLLDRAHIQPSQPPIDRFQEGARPLEVNLFIKMY